MGSVHSPQEFSMKIFKSGSVLSNCGAVAILKVEIFWQLFWRIRFYGGRRDDFNVTFGEILIFFFNRSTFFSNKHSVAACLSIGPDFALCSLHSTVQMHIAFVSLPFYISKHFLQKLDIISFGIFITKVLMKPRLTCQCEWSESLQI